MFYFFHDSSEDLSEDYAFDGADYQKLIDCCAKYSAYFSLGFSSPEHEVREAGTLAPLWRETWPFGGGIAYRAFYPCTENNITYLRQKVSGLFEWLPCWGYTNPEDPVFYRRDGTIFFWACVHEGEAAINARETEDVYAVISGPGWTLKTNKFGIDNARDYGRPCFRVAEDGTPQPTGLLWEDTPEHIRYPSYDLISAAKDNATEIAQLLLELGADVSLKDINGKTALDYAVEGGYDEMIALLQQK